MFKLSLNMLWKERKKAFSLVITIATTLCVSIVLLQFFHNPNINYLINIFKETADKEGVKAIDYQQFMQFLDGMYKGAMILILLIIFISLIIYSCNYYNKTNSRFVGLLKIGGCNNTEVLFFQVIQLVIITVVGYLISIAVSFFIIPLVQAAAYQYIGVNDSIFYYTSLAYITSFPIVLLLLVFIILIQISYTIRAVIPSLLKCDNIVSFKKRKRSNTFINWVYVLFFGIGALAMYGSELNQGLVFPALLYIIGAYGIGTSFIPGLLEKWIKRNNVSALKGLVFSNYILNIQQIKSIILMFILSTVILLTMACTNLDDPQYTVLFQLGYVLTNIILSFTLVNRFKINRINKSKYYYNLSRLGLAQTEIVYTTKKEVLLTYSTIIILTLIYIVNLNIAFVYQNKMSSLFAGLLMLEFILPMFVACIITVYQERTEIKND